MSTMLATNISLVNALCDRILPKDWQQPKQLQQQVEEEVGHPVSLQEGPDKDLGVLVRSRC
jgi:hypothetical protein